MKITITRELDKMYPNRIRAHIDDDEGMQGVSCARSTDHVAEAIGDLVLNYPDKFNVIIVDEIEYSQKLQGEV